MNTTKDKRAQLLNMAAGGDGHTTDYIERVTLDGAQPQQRIAYMYHGFTYGRDGRIVSKKEFLGTLDHCRKMWFLPYLGDDDAPDMTAAPIEDNGRHIAAEVWQQQYEHLNILPYKTI